MVIANNLVNKAIVARDGATATSQGNSTAATLAMFVDAPQGDMHLQAGATAAIDKVTAPGDVTTDWDGQPRTNGSVRRIWVRMRTTRRRRPPTARRRRRRTCASSRDDGGAG